LESKRVHRQLQHKKRNRTSGYSHGHAYQDINLKIYIQIFCIYNIDIYIAPIYFPNKYITF